MLGKYPEPIWAMGEEADAAEDADFDYSSTFEWRSPVQGALVPRTDRAGTSFGVSRPFFLLSAGDLARLGDAPASARWHHGGGKRKRDKEV